MSDRNDEIREVAQKEASDALSERGDYPIRDLTMDEEKVYDVAFIRELMDQLGLDPEDLGFGAADQVVREGDEA